MEQYYIILSIIFYNNRHTHKPSLNTTTYKWKGRDKRKRKKRRRSRSYGCLCVCVCEGGGGVHEPNIQVILISLHHPIPRIHQRWSCKSRVGGRDNNSRLHSNINRLRFRLPSRVDSIVVWAGLFWSLYNHPCSCRLQKKKIIIMTSVSISTQSTRQVRDYNSFVV